MDKMHLYTLYIIQSLKFSKKDMGFIKHALASEKKSFHGEIYKLPLGCVTYIGGNIF